MTWREVAWEVAGDAALNEVVDARVRVTLADDLRELTEVACGIRKGTHNTGCLIYSFRPHTQQPNDAGDSASEHNLALSA